MCGRYPAALMPGPHCCVAMESREIVAHGATVGHVKTSSSSSGRSDRKEHSASPHRDSYYLVVAYYASDSLPPPNGGRAGVRGQYLKIKYILTKAPSSMPGCARIRRTRFCSSIEATARRGPSRGAEK